MKTHVLILSIAMLGATACGNDDDRTIADMSDDHATAMVDHSADAVMSEAAIVQRSARMDARAACIRTADAETWKLLSLTTDQIRWMEQLQARMNARNEKASERVEVPGQAYTYTFSTAERRKLAEILTDEQLEQWTGLCPDHTVTGTRM